MQPYSILTLLLVEDVDADAERLLKMMRSSPHLHGAAMVRAHTLASALGIITSVAPECVLLNLGLRGAGGLSGLWSIRAADRHAAVIALSARDDEGMALATVREGAQDYLVKGSVDATRLNRAILHAVERQRALSLLLDGTSRYRLADPAGEALELREDGWPPRA